MSEDFAIGESEEVLASMEAELDDDELNDELDGGDDFDDGLADELDDDLDDLDDDELNDDELDDELDDDLESPRTTPSAGDEHGFSALETTEEMRIKLARLRAELAARQRGGAATTMSPGSLRAKARLAEDRKKRKGRGPSPLTKYMSPAERDAADVIRKRQEFLDTIKAKKQLAEREKMRKAADLKAREAQAVAAAADAERARADLIENWWKSQEHNKKNLRPGVPGAKQLEPYSLSEKMEAALAERAQVNKWSHDEVRSNWTQVEVALGSNLNASRLGRRVKQALDDDAATGAHGGNLLARLVAATNATGPKRKRGNFGGSTSTKKQIRRGAAANSKAGDAEHPVIRLRGWLRYVGPLKYLSPTDRKLKIAFDSNKMPIGDASVGSDGIWLGVELVEPLGLHDGTVGVLRAAHDKHVDAEASAQGAPPVASDAAAAEVVPHPVKNAAAIYFKCPAGHGVLVRPRNVRRVPVDLSGDHVHHPPKPARLLAKAKVNAAAAAAIEHLQELDERKAAHESERKSRRRASITRLSSSPLAAQVSSLAATGAAIEDCDDAAAAAAAAQATAGTAAPASQRATPRRGHKSRVATRGAHRSVSHGSSPANGSPANGSPANGSPANGSPESGSPAKGSPERGKRGSTGGKKHSSVATRLSQANTLIAANAAGEANAEAAATTAHATIDADPAALELGADDGALDIDVLGSPIRSAPAAADTSVEATADVGRPIEYVEAFWKKKIAKDGKKTGKPYYINKHVKGETTWKAPAPELIIGSPAALAAKAEHDAFVLAEADAALQSLAQGDTSAPVKEALRTASGEVTATDAAKKHAKKTVVRRRKVVKKMVRKKKGAQTPEQKRRQAHKEHLAAQKNHVARQAAEAVWQKKFDKDSGRAYYKNIQTKVKTWKPPSDPSQIIE